MSYFPSAYFPAEYYSSAYFAGSGGSSPVRAETPPLQTSGLYTFGVQTENIDIITEMWERCGRDASELSASDLEKARRTLNFMFASWANQGPNLWSVEEQRFSLAASTASYTLPADTVDIIQAVVSSTSGSVTTDLEISKISRSEYFNIPVKAQTGQRPTQFYLERIRTPVLYLWPVPDNDDYTLIYYRLRMLQDVGAYTNSPDAVNRWMDAIAAGGAARLAIKAAPDRVEVLKQEAGEALAIAKGEDRERVPLRLYPDLTGMC
jgi:hypothetical protein